ncbi:glycosyltransferase involved in cell wall biosynthesis [Curtobacterium luteum]|uniref:Glycosyl transferase n=2 Tax=Curtobacterium TaxID=2034 RepID=A0A8H9L183_9MICO|nr:glycosyltransferase family 2 protein [Curtobacterium luteum]MBM7803979.1 glycosyltransferase involved in cell wall biosynthesis [Curtobacterium luteum]GGL05442.1 glycosyl transferase [Curtobacterium luteum]
MNVDVILPCLDEADALPRVIGRLPQGYRAIVVDNGSTDGSADVARAHGALVVTEPRRGFGSACAAGLAAATADYVAFCDADASMDPAELPGLLDRVASGRTDLALGRRVPTSRGAWAPHARFANRVLAVLMRRATGYRLRDLGPMRVMRREQLVALDLQDRRSGYPLEMVLAAHAAGLRVDESDIGYAQRIGDSKVTGTLRGTVNAVRDMSRLLRAYRSGERRPGTVARDGDTSRSGTTTGLEARPTPADTAPLERVVGTATAEVRS